MTLMTVDLKDKTPSANLGLYKEGCAHPVRSSARGPDPNRAFGPASRHGVSTWAPASIGESLFCLVEHKTWLESGP